MKNKNIQRKAKEELLNIPIGILQDRKLAILESLAEYLHNKKEMKYSEIARLLNRDDRTIWTVCNRAKKKRIVSINAKASFKVKQKINKAKSKNRQ